MEEFSFRTRGMALDRLRGEEFDLLIIGGGITGVASVRDAALRGMRTALVEKRDFAWGTSSRSSKLIHGGLRYLENFELGLVFEALAERAHLLKTAPHLVRPLKFFMPVYRGIGRGRFLLSAGMWLYDILALFRAPGFHKRLSRKKMLEAVPFLKEENLKGAFEYYDAGMWDDQLVIETLRSAAKAGAAVANYAEAREPIWKEGRIVGFRVVDRESSASEEMAVRAKRVVVCAGPWTDEVGKKMSPEWRPWLKPSKGVHLVFDLKRIPIEGAVVMSHPSDGRIAFVIPRPDFGAGIALVGTTDGPTPAKPEEVDIERDDVDYLMNLLQRYFPRLNLKKDDIISAYVGIRPLMGQGPNPGEMEPVAAPLAVAAPPAVAAPLALSARGGPAEALHGLSREHFIGKGPGGTVIVAGGKYTTHRRMAKEIIDFTVSDLSLSFRMRRGKTGEPVNLQAQASAVETARSEAARRGITLPPELVERYGAEALDMIEGDDASGFPADPDGFPRLAAQFRHAVRTGMVLHLEDFYLRRVPLFLARRDHGLPWAEALSTVWAEELGKEEEERKREVERLKEEIEKREKWREKCSSTVSTN